MTADRLLRFYPRAWRDRYGDEFLDLIGPQPLRVQQVVDISMGAIDAWLSPDVQRSATNASITTSHATQGGGAMLATFKAAACAGQRHQMSRKDIMLSTTVMILGTLALVSAGTALKRFGNEGAAEAILALAFPLPATAAMHILYLKTQPRRVQLAVTGTTLVLLLGSTYIATLI